MAFNYLDHNAGTALAPNVLEAMLPYLRQQQGNPSSSHRFGRFARAAIDTARAQVARLVNVQPEQVWFTSGGTESNNQALNGIRHFHSDGHILVSSIEHPAVLQPAYDLQRYGFQMAEIPVDGSGYITPAALSEMLGADSRMVSVMWANNETGVIQDISALSQLTRQKGIIFHTDAVQAAGKLALDFPASGVHLMSLSAHKFGGPKGIGALIVDNQLDWPGYVLGGGQENDKRSGTENVAAIAGFGVAADYVRNQLESYQRHCLALRHQLEQGLKSLAGATIFAEESERLPNTVFFSLAGFDADTLLMALDKYGFSVASGSACGTGRQTPSHVLTAMGVEANKALGAVRVSLGLENTAAQISELLAILSRESERFNHLLNR
ncbi:Cysteine desulfurase [Methylophaga frappieri]|uniref:cysteine desulfurase n=1 Tax=Methylophaga frappieri (strain ATCC BAA-2434 / DSM 25690 / JAM7) TaxID=754477 RepID=I1YEZ7_METFJ|nr:cysteine desulfurase family protein [Methylophaga frappieri]AFJ01490.1 Cysteine desulfurase [Methylophaga frappieri]